MKNLGAEHENLDQKSYLIIKEMITNRKLLPGDKIHQEKLAHELGISRTPLVSALKYLEKEKLVEPSPAEAFLFACSLSRKWSAYLNCARCWKAWQPEERQPVLPTVKSIRSTVSSSSFHRL